MGATRDLARSAMVPPRLRWNPSSMSPDTRPARSAEDVLADVRAFRFRDGVFCPRCRSRRIHRWGFFNHRQRYRCLSCGRTFSDLTGTPAAYSKRLTLWPTFGACMADSLTVRRAADRAGVSPRTAFRWRHRLLDALREDNRARVAGTAGLSRSTFAYSQKGARGLRRPARRHGSKWRWPQPPRVCVVRVADRDGEVWAGAIMSHYPSSEALAGLLRPRIAPEVELVAPFGRASPYAIAALRLGCRFRSTPPSLGAQVSSDPDVARVRAVDRALLRWLVRFRGVATRYLDNYLCWHRVVELDRRETMLAGLLGWDRWLRSAAHAASAPAIGACRCGSSVRRDRPTSPDNRAIESDEPAPRPPP